MSLRQARADCGLSETGGFANVGEFRSRAIKDRFLSTDDYYTLKSLRGTVICNNWERTVTGSRTGDTPLTGMRPNYNEVSAWAQNGRPSFRYTQSSTAIIASGENSRDNGQTTLGGYIYVGRVPASTRNYKLVFRYRKTMYGPCVCEVIGWPDGYFVGTPTYYAQYLNTSTNSQNYGSPTLSIDGAATPYITLTLQGNTSAVNKDSAYIEIQSANLGMT